MILFKQDLVADYLFTLYKKSVFKQNEGIAILCKEYLEKNINIDNQFYVELMRIMEISQVSKFDWSPYKIHKSYPSARSYYKQKLWIKLEDGNYITKDFITNNIDKYRLNLYKFQDSFDLLLTTDLITLDKYSSIYKSLTILEYGHIIYNIDTVCRMFRASIEKIIINELGIFIKLNYKNIKNPKCIELSELKELYKLRSSGKYYTGLQNHIANANDIVYDIKFNYRERFQKLFNSNLNDDIKIINFKNNGSFFEFEDKKFEYSDLNSEYVYIDFRHCTQYTLFLLKKDLTDIEKVEKEILMIGYLAQDICLKNAKVNVYNRPLKQVLTSDKWELLNKNKEYDEYYQFYGVVTGYCN